MTGIEKAVEVAGGQAELAKLMGVSRQAIQQWVARGYIPRQQCAAMEAQTGVSQAELLGLTQDPFGEGA